MEVLTKIWLLEQQILPHDAFPDTKALQGHSSTFYVCVLNKSILVFSFFIF